uniref:Crystallin, gamma S3 n=1 Tax=Paramormyrops kingsleyae TaxID=1676925 RepID=A0A3B3S938_9TELE
ERNTAEHMRGIIFYEDQNFHGRCDCTDLQAHFSRCNSIHMDRGFWVLYEQPNYTGSQYVLTHGKYPDYQRWMGFNDSVRSCRVTPALHSRVPARPGSASMNVPTLWARFWSQHEVHSCKVLDGAWILHDQPKYRGHQCLLQRGKYQSFGKRVTQRCPLLVGLSSSLSEHGPTGMCLYKSAFEGIL